MPVEILAPVAGQRIITVPINHLSFFALELELDMPRAHEVGLTAR
jgi:hypothetical protein